MAAEIFNLPGYYAAMLPRLTQAARDHGYALAVHGSLLRDFDLIAVPWVEQVSTPAVLAEALRIASDGFIEYGRPGRDPMQLPHGRLAWSIHLGGRRYIDLSVFTDESSGIRNSELKTE